MNAPNPSINALANVRGQQLLDAAAGAERGQRAAPAEVNVLRAELRLQRLTSSGLPAISIKKVYSAGEKSLAPLQKQKRAQWRAKRAKRKRELSARSAHSELSARQAQQSRVESSKTTVDNAAA